MVSNEFINECKKNAYKNRLGTISIKDITKKNGSVIKTNDAIEGSLIDYKIYGDSFQNITSGKNLFDYITGFKSSINGTVNTLSEDGTITVTGVPTSDYTQIVTQYDITDKLEDGESYRLSMTNNQNYVWYELIGRQNGTNKRYYTSREYSGSQNVCVVDKTTYDSYVIKVITSTKSTWGTSSRTISSKFQLEKGKTKTEFEIYTGGSASPNPSYPQEIINVGDKTNNIYNGEYEMGGYDLSTGEKTSSDRQYRNKDFINVNPNCTYIFSVNGEKITEKPRYFYYDNDKKLLSTEVVNGEFKTPNNCYFINWHSSDLKASYPNGLNNIMISTSNDYNYEPYGYKIPVNVKSENLFDKDNYNIINSYISNSNILTSSGAGISLYIPCKPNTEYIINKSNNGTNNRFCVFTTENVPKIGDTIINYVGTRQGEDNSSSYTIKTLSNVHYLGIFISVDKTTPSYQEIAKTIEIKENNEGLKISSDDNIKNIFDKNDFKELNAYFNSTTPKITTNDFNKTLYIPCNPNTYYYVSVTSKSGAFNIGYTNELPQTNTQVYSITQRNTLKTGINAKYLVCRYIQTVNATISLEEVLNSIIIKKGSNTPEKYTPYYNETVNIYLNEPLRKIGKYQDYIDFKNKKVVRNVKKTTLDNSINWLTNYYETEKRIYTSKNDIDTSMVGVLANNDLGLLMSEKYSSSTVRDMLDLKVKYGIGLSSSGYLSIVNPNFSTGTDFVNDLQNNPIDLCYVTSTPIEETIELPNIELIEGKNIITIGTELESTIEIEYNSWENKIKNSDRLQNIVIDSGCSVNNEIIGSVYAKKITCDILDSNELDLENKRLNIQVGVKYDNDKEEMINIGQFTIERSKDEQTANTGQIIAYDDINNKLEDKYVCGIDYTKGNVTLRDLYIDLCNQLSLTPKNINFDNNTIPILDNPFTNGEKNRLVLQTIEKVSGTFSDIDNETNEIDLCWLSNNIEPDYTFYQNDYATLEGGKTVYGPINCLVIKNSQIDDENVTIKDDESIAINGEHTLTINEDYILYNSELRQSAINTIWNKVHNLTYVDCKLTTLYGKPFLKLGNKIRVYKSDIEYFDTYVLLHKFTYDGSFESVIQSPVLTQQEIKNKQNITLGQALKNAEIEINKQKKAITALVQESTENTKKTSELQIEVDKISEKVEQNEDFLETKTGKNQIELTDSLEYQPISFVIQGHSNQTNYIYPSDDLFPSDDLY